MTIQSGNSLLRYPVPAGAGRAFSTRGGSASNYSFSRTICSAPSVAALDRAYDRSPNNPALKVLAALFSAIALMQAFERLCGTGYHSPPPPPPCPPPLQQGRMWDVFFDSKSGTKTRQLSPLVLDLNGNGRADITGSNITGNGKLEGKTVKGFDLDPENRQWETKSHDRRPGNGAPALPAGTTAQVFDKSGKLVKTLSADELQALQKNNKKGWNAKGGDMGLGLGADMRAEFRDANGQLVSELKRDGTNKNHPLYFWGNKNENEWTKAWDPATGGDGMLVWDTDGDGKITSGKELFGHVDLNGKNTFKNGYEKLAHYFDKDGDGVVRGSELQGLKIWEDRNGDGITQQGELVDLAQHGIRELNTGFNASDMSSSFGFRQPGQPEPVVAAAPIAPAVLSAMAQGWQIFQLIEVMRRMQMSGFGLA